MQATDILNKGVQFKEHPMFSIIVCSVTLIVGVLLTIIGKKFMRIILTLLAGVATCFGVLRIFEEFPNLISNQHEWIIYSICILSALIAMFVTFKYFVKRIAISILCSLSFAMSFLIVFQQLSERKIITMSNQTAHNIITCAVVICGAVIGGMIGCCSPRNMSKITGAVLGSFFIIASTGTLLNELVFTNTNDKMQFDLFRLLDKGSSYVHETVQPLTCAATPTVDAETCNKETNVIAVKDIVMMVLFVVICIASLIYQFSIKKNEKRERTHTNSKDTDMVQV